MLNKQNFLYTEGGGISPVRVKNPDAVEFVVIDLFCGAGGTSTGFHKAMLEGNNVALVAACINHDPQAIKSHFLNYPDILHFEEDIRTVKLKPIVDLIRKYRLLYPNAKVILWASLECTNFSKAKGGQPREADSRTLADHLDRYVKALNPDYIQIENVVEFMSWGPLDENGKPVSKKSGSDWLKWREHINSFGYYDDWREMNSADYGAYTSRNRLFGCFAKHGLPISWPESTHAKIPGLDGMFGVQNKWKAVKDVLDFTDEGKSIFNRKKELVDASLERIYAGLLKFVAGGKEAFLLKYNSMAANGDKKHCVRSLEIPSPVIPTHNRTALCFIAKYYSGKPAGKVIPVTGPAGTVKCSDGQSLINCVPFITQRNSGDPDGRILSVDRPARTLTSTGGNQEIVQPFILNTNFKNQASSIDEPAKTLLASRHHPYVLNPVFLTQYYTSGGGLASVDEPGRTLGTKDTISKIHLNFIEKTYTGNGNIASVESPAGTVMPNDKHRLINCQPFILNPSYKGHTTGTDVPCVVIVARQDKAPLYLIQFDQDPNVKIPVYDGDTPIMVKIKEFMALYGLSDIKMRMLKVSELLLIQGFPKDYHLAGNETDKKKFIGNSVVPEVVSAWCVSMAIKSREQRQIAA